MSVWNISVIIASSILLIILLRKEILRNNKARLFLRIIASVIAVIALVCMAIPLTVKQENLNKNKQIIVLTAGFDQENLNAFQKNKNIPVISEEDFLADPSVVYDSVYVFGFGLPSEILQSIHQHFVFHTSSVKAGITAVNWNPTLKKGEELSVQGSYTNQTANPVKLVLTGFNTVIDSVLTPAKQTLGFHLQGVPKQNGKAVYSLIAIAGKDTLEKEPVPLELISSHPVKVMMLSTTPDFENKFLKNWLSQNGYTVVNKTTISTNKSDRSFFNASPLSLDRITSALLDSFDIIVSDEAAISSLSKPEQENLYSQVTKDGLGLIIRGDTIANTNNWYTGPFRLYKLSGTQPSAITVSFLKEQYFKAILPVEEPLFIRMQSGMQPLTTDSAGNPVTAAVAEGAGKIIFTTLNNTYNWLLSGNGNQYYRFWNRVLQKAAKPHTASSIIEIRPALPVIGQPVVFSINSNKDTIPLIRIDQSLPAFTQNPQLPNQWQTVYWPTQPGWQNSVVLDNAEYNWYVYDKKDWPYISATERMEAADRYAARPDLINIGEQGKSSPVPVSLVYFFLPFIICCGFLWVERKIS